MPPQNPKNFAISAAGTDLGLGDMLTQQLQDQEMERKKKLMTQAPRNYGDSALGPAAMSLLGKGGGLGAF